MKISIDLNVRNDLKHNTVSENMRIQKESSLPFSVCALNINGDLNIGNIIRSACIFAAEKIFIFGKKKYDKRSTVGSHNYVNIEKIVGVNENNEYDVELFYDIMLKNCYEPIFIEQDGECLNEFDFSSLDKKPCFVFGNEGYGIPENMIKDSKKLEIKQHGVLRSLNVSSAAAIVMYEFSKTF